ATGSLMPRARLKEAGLEVERDYTPSYAGSHDAVGAAVNSGKIDAGAMNYALYHSLVGKGVIDGSKVRVLAETEPVAMGATIVVREGLGPELKKAIPAKLPAHWPTDPELLRLIGSAPSIPDEAAVEAARKGVTDLGIELENIRGPRRCPYATCGSASATCTPSPGSTSMWPRASSSAWSAPAGRASRRCCAA